MAALHLSTDEYTALLRSALLDDLLAGADPSRVIVVADGELGRPVPSAGSLPVVVARLGDPATAGGDDGVDVVVEPADLATVVDAVERHPHAALALVLLLRASAGVDPDRALALESATYSTLQAGAEFAAWRAATAADPAIGAQDGPTVRVERPAAHELHVVLDRPAAHNAITARMRDELCDALVLARLDDEVTRVVVRGDGPSFCSGGELREFGARPDPSVGHLVRLMRSPARLLLGLAARGVEVEARIHGHTLGGGIEMAAFARRVVVTGEVSIGLPEVGLGLIPGAGGTVSLPRRIGPQRTAWLGLTGRRIDAATALAWGLADATVSGAP